MAPARPVAVCARPGRQCGTGPNPPGGAERAVGGQRAGRRDRTVDRLIAEGWRPRRPRRTRVRMACAPRRSGPVGSWSVGDVLEATPPRPERSESLSPFTSPCAQAGRSGRGWARTRASPACARSGRHPSMAPAVPGRHAMLSSDPRRDGGTGRRVGLKNRWGQPRAGSSPALGIRSLFSGTSGVSLNTKTGPKGRFSAFLGTRKPGLQQAAGRCEHGGKKPETVGVFENRWVVPGRPAGALAGAP